MALKLYTVSASPPCRAVLLTAETLDIEIDQIPISLLEREQLKPSFTKLNPQHTVPTLVDGDFVVWDSHAIMGYLVNKYAEDDSLYPKDPEKRAVIDQRLHFDSGVLFPLLRSAAGPVIYMGEKEIPQEKVYAIHDSYRFLEAFLEDKEWIAGDSLTIADFSIMTTLTTLSVIAPLADDDHPNIMAWLQRCESLPCYESEKEGLQKFRDMYESCLSS